MLDPFVSYVLCLIHLAVAAVMAYTMAYYSPEVRYWRRAFIFLLGLVSAVAIVIPFTWVMLWYTGAIFRKGFLEAYAVGLAILLHPVLDKLLDRFGTLR